MTELASCSKLRLQTCPELFTPPFPVQHGTGCKVMSNVTLLWAEKQLRKPALRKARCQAKLNELGWERTQEAGRQPRPLKRCSVFEEGSRRRSIWEEGAEANKMIRIWQGQQRKEWERRSMSTASIANTELQKTPARAFLHAFFFFPEFLEEEQGW